MFIVGVTTVAVSTMSVVMEEKKTDNVRCQTKAANNEDDLRVGDFLWFDKSLDRFEEDGKTQRNQEDPVDEGTEGLCALPTVRVLFRVRSLVRDLDSPQSNEE
jgi:hypothetical protein